MDIVYILGNGSPWGNNELRYSLRSLALYARNVGDIIIVGECPDWVKDVHHSYLPDPFSRKADNAWYKLKNICRHHPEPFVLMNDDFYLLQGTDFETIPKYADGDISALVSKYDRKAPYPRCQQATAYVLASNGHPQRNYALHVPIIIRPEIIKPMFKHFSIQPGISFRNLYGNLCTRPHVELPDLKINTPMELQEIDAMLKDKMYFSIGDSFLNDTGKNYLANLYPNPSPWEK